MINTIGVKRFKSYQSGILPLAPSTLLVGANASGKSNIIEALSLLSKLAEGSRLSVLGDGQLSNESLLRGSIRDWGYQGAKSFALSCTIQSEQLSETYCLDIELSIATDGNLYVTQEQITTEKFAVPLYRITSQPQGMGKDVFVEYHNFAAGDRTPHIVCSSHMAIFTQLLSEIRFPQEHQESRNVIPKIAECYVNLLTRIIVLEPEPQKMRGYSDKKARKIQTSAANVSGILYNICQSSILKENLLHWIRHLPEQEIIDIDFLETDRGEVMVQLTEMFGDRAIPYDATMLSDGTLRVLAIAAAMLSAPEESLVVIEDVDRGVHASRVEGLLNRINSTARSRRIQVLMSSHNPALLDALPNTAIPETVFCYRDRDRGSSELIRLQDIPDYPELIARGTVGHLMTQNVLDAFVKDRPGREEKKQKAMEWLTSIA